MQWKGCAECYGWELRFWLVMVKAKVNKWTVLFVTSLSYEHNVVLLDFDTRSCVVCQQKVSESVFVFVSGLPWSGASAFTGCSSDGQGTWRRKWPRTENSQRLVLHANPRRPRSSAWPANIRRSSTAAGDQLALNSWHWIVATDRLVATWHSGTAV